MKPRRHLNPEAFVLLFTKMMDCDTLRHPYNWHKRSVLQSIAQAWQLLVTE